LPTRREFICSVMAASTVAACNRGQRGAAADAGRAHADASAEPDAAGVGAPRKPRRPLEPEEASLLRESVLPPAMVQRDDTLSGIRRVEPKEAELVVVAGTDLTKMTRRGVEAIGGMRGFVPKGGRVVLAPNFAFARPPGTGVTTHPEVVREVILMCQEAGAKEIVCLDYTTHATPRAYRVNKAYDAVKGTRAQLLSPWSAEQHVRVGDFEKLKLHREKLGWQAVASVLLRCDALISVPVFKHHREVGATGSLKKMMGCIWRRRSYHVHGLQQCIAELSAVLRPTLTVTDASRILCTNGPDGPGRVCSPGEVLVSADPVLADAYACRYIGLKPEKVAYLKAAAALGVGKLDPRKARIERIGEKG
jgi:uncharacterized protein (DUF362 family)